MFHAGEKTCPSPLFAYLKCPDLFLSNNFILEVITLWPIKS